MLSKTIMVGPGRCGSQLLQFALDSIPDFKCGSELFHSWAYRLEPYRSIIKDLFNHNITTVYKGEGQEEEDEIIFPLIHNVEYIETVLKHFDFIRILYYQITNYPELIDYIKNCNHKIIHLKRKNILGHYVSGQIAEQTKKWSVTAKEKYSYSNIKVDINLLLGHIVRLKEFYSQFDDLFKDRTDIYDITYENLISHWVSQTEKIQRFMWLKPQPIPQIFKKQIDKPLSMVISNFIELIEAGKDSSDIAEYVKMSKYNFGPNWFNPHCFQKFLLEFKDKPVRFLEIGSFQGRASIWMLDNILTHEDSHLDCLEPGFLVRKICFSENNRELKLNLEAGGYLGKKVNLIEDTSRVLRHYDDESYDFIYVDGCHDSHVTLEDAVNAFRMIKPGGIIAFDDYGWTEIQYTDGTLPGPAIDAFLECYKLNIEVLHKEYQVWVRKLI